MTLRIGEIVTLSGVVLFCWIGVLGMWRMREPVQALHYVSLPATGGAAFLCLAVFLSQGIGQTSLKVLVTMAILLASNSTVSHAIARAFRARELGHWEPLDGDPIEPVDEQERP